MCTRPRDFVYVRTCMYIVLTLDPTASLFLRFRLVFALYTYTVYPAMHKAYREHG